MKTFEAKCIYGNDHNEVFTETDAPAWLTSVNTVKGSTMDERWFWTDHVLTLNINESIKTDFRTITRIS